RSAAAISLRRPAADHGRVLLHDRAPRAATGARSVSRRGERAPKKCSGARIRPSSLKRYCTSKEAMETLPPARSDGRGHHHESEGTWPVRAAGEIRARGITDSMA